MEKQLFGRFLLGAGLGGLVGTGVLALLSISLSGPFPQQRSAGAMYDGGEAELVAEAPAAAAETADSGAAATVAAEPVEPVTETAGTDHAAEMPAETTSDAGPADLAEPQDQPPAFSPVTDLTELPALTAETAPDPALSAALEAALGEGASVTGGAEAPAQPPGLADAASDGLAETPAAPEAAPVVAGIAQDEGATPSALAAPPEPIDQPGAMAAGQPEQPETSAVASKPADPAEDRAPDLALAPEPPPLTAEEELMLAQMAADELVEETTPIPAPIATVKPGSDEFVILDELPPVTVPEASPVAPEVVEAPPAPAETAAPETEAAQEPAAAVSEETRPAELVEAPVETPAETPAETSVEAADPVAPPASELTEAPVEVTPADEAPADVAEAAAGEPARILTLDGSSTMPGSTGTTRETGVETSRLPRIGDSPVDPAAAAESDPLAPRTAFARPFDNPANKPRFAVILMDDGSAGLDRAALADLPFAVTFAIDPQLPNAGEIAAIYRQAGQEVVMLTSGLPKGAEASDVAVAFDAMARALPESVAAMDVPSRSFQGDRPLATIVVPEIESQGRGVITWNTGLNAADQVAKREDVPSTVIFRDLDAEGEDAPVIRRYLDRAAFKAVQEGGVTVFGRAAHGPTLAALLEWAVEGRAATVELAPITAMLSVD